MFTADEAVNMLLTTENPTNIKTDKPPKQAVISNVCITVMNVSGAGRRKENGHQIKSLSESQL